MAIVEREEHIDILLRALTEATHGAGQIITIGGDPGTGKTELLQRLAADAERAGALVLTAAGSRAEVTLHMGIVRQLFQQAAKASSATGELARLLEDGALTSALTAGSDHATDQPAGPVVDVLCAALLDPARDRTVVICVDDVQYADDASIHCLLSLAAQLRQVRMLILLAEGPAWTRPIAATLSTPPSGRRIDLAPLTHGGVAAILAVRLGCVPGPAAIAQAHRLTGGNPLLVHALADDTLDIRATGDDTPHAGAAYGRGVLRCLHRTTPAMLSAAHLIAVLDDVAGSHTPTQPALLGHLLKLDPTAVARSLAALTAAGLLERGGFRHAAAHAAVRADIDPAVRADIHRRAALWLHHADAPADAVARHLVAAGHHDEPWTGALLEQAAAQTVLDGRPEFAISCLRLAVRASTDERDRARLSVLHAQAEWRMDPGSVRARLPELIAIVRTGWLTPRYSIIAAKLLLWFGHADDARTALRSARDASAELGRSRAWLITWHPALAPMLPAPPDTGVAAAERALERLRRDDEAMEAAATALLHLVWADRSDRVLAWYAEVGDADLNRLVPTWRAILTAIRAEAALRLGDLREAQRLARAALQGVAAHDWGIAAGLPRSILLRAATEMGAYEQASVELDHALPEPGPQSLFDLHYLHARGRYALAVDLPHAALGDFQACGELMARWNITAPALVAWCEGAAWALLALGKSGKAAELPQRQLRDLGTEYRRTRGAALRVLAMTCELWARQRLLSEAARVLQASGDQLELAHTLADLSKVQYALGDGSRGRLAMRRALHLADQCSARALSESLQPTLVAPAVTGRPAGQIDGDEATPALSDAERRVAALAVQGHTNRQIARKLHITISTVEQHLTRSYRKLKVSRRSDLPLGLQPGFSAD
ncbi:AAA family ATPase [Micromonospora sp. DT231]|uniref:helix-turn-helix transcriptional regulator n=1 Tax=Micromonospora sp. DT231 TaxID=3416526 RepID=UPI003CE80D83